MSPLLLVDNCGHSPASGEDYRGVAQPWNAVSLLNAGRWKGSPCASSSDGRWAGSATGTAAVPRKCGWLRDVFHRLISELVGVAYEHLAASLNCILEIALMAWESFFTEHLYAETDQRRPPATVDQE